MILDSFKVTDMVAIVTGCEQGLGMGMAVGLAQAGADIFGVGIGDMSAVKAEVEKAGRKFASVKANLMSIEPVDMVFDECIKAFGKVDILVNNAGIIRREDSVKFSEKDWDDVININQKTVFFMCQRAANEFIKQGTPGKIINIASMLSFQGGIRVPSYAASKGAVRSMTMLMANEWAKHNINVNAIAPGYMATANTAPIRADEGRAEAILDRIPAGRWGTPEDLAGACVFLCSPAAQYINGYTLAVDGGWLAR